MGKNVLVTGCSSGIGHATALKFAAEGWRVAAALRDRGDADRALVAHEAISLVALDIRDPVSVDEALVEAASTLGPIDVLINNAGFGQYGVFEAIDGEALRRNYETNVFGTANMMRAMLPRMREAGGGTILNVSSCGGRFGIPASSVYVSTKWALEGLCESAWLEFAAVNVKLKLLEPGGVDSAFHKTAARLQRGDGGIAAYAGFLKTFEAAMARNGWELEAPAVIADRIHAAATDGTDRLRYAAGPALDYLIEARREHDDAGYEKVLRAQYE